MAQNKNDYIEVSLERGLTGKHSVDRTVPRKQATNTPDIEDIHRLERKISDLEKTEPGPGPGPVVSGLLVETTYSALKQLRDEGKLVPGQQYRITDYFTFTTTTNTESAGHVFDIIVVADSESVLNENARAVLHSGDTYFANNNLSAWKLKYCLDNDTTRFAWADSANGKGVIYWLKDEFENEAPYDFKNIIYKASSSFSYFQWGTTYFFTRDPSLDSNGYYGWRCSTSVVAWDNPYCFTTVETPTTTMTLYKNTEGTVISYGGNIVSVSGDSYSSFTFGYETTESNETVIKDASLLGIDKKCYNNIIKEYINSDGKNSLNFNIIRSSTPDFMSYDNYFGIDCHDNLLGKQSYSNKFGSGCYKNTLGSQTACNKFGDNCYSNILDYCSYNIFEGYNHDIKNGGSDNIFRSNSYKMELSSNSNKNIIGQECHDIYFENNNTYNTLGPGCYDIHFRGGSKSVLGTQCNMIYLGVQCERIELKSYCFGIYVNWLDQNYGNFQNIVFESECNSIELVPARNDITKPNQNVHIYHGVHGTYSNHLVLTIDEKEDIETSIYANGSQTLLV